MITFKELHSNFEKKETDLVELENYIEFDRYLLIRSLDSGHLKKILNDEKSKLKGEGLYEAVYNDRSITIKFLRDFIKREYPTVKAQRMEEEKYLPSILSEFSNVRCGVRNDDLSDLVKGLVRDKSIVDKNKLDEKVSYIVRNTITDYIYWQYFNQATTDLLEHIFNDHPKVIPTLRKIKYADFFIEIGGRIIPFDLKITHLSENYYDLLDKGLVLQDNSADSFAIGSNDSEIEKIKSFYKDIKKEHKLPNFKDIDDSKLGVIKKLEELENKDPAVKEFLEQTYKHRTELVESTKQDLDRAIWWNFKYQGERLFKNNNRFYVFLAYKNSFEDPRGLKNNFDAIKTEVYKVLNNLTASNLSTIKYHYDKSTSSTGDYVVRALATIVTQ